MEGRSLSCNAWLVLGQVAQVSKQEHWRHRITGASPSEPKDALHGTELLHPEIMRSKLLVMQALILGLQAHMCC